MQDHQVREMLRRSLVDGQLSRLERDDFRALLDRAPDGQKRAVYQSMAFDLANEAIINQTVPHYSALNWLEKIVKLLTPLAPANTAPRSITEALFAPRHDCSARIVQLFGAARASVDVCVFTITDDRISDAIISAHRRGVKIRIITDDDKCLDPGSDIQRFRQAGVPVRCDRSENHMHHKFAIFDGELLLSGSYNWTRSASQYNEENILLTSEPRLILPFRELFDHLWTQFAQGG